MTPKLKKEGRNKMKFNINEDAYKKLAKDEGKKRKRIYRKKDMIIAVENDEEWIGNENHGHPEDHPSVKKGK